MRQYFRHIALLTVLMFMASSALSTVMMVEMAGAVLDESAPLVMDHCAGMANMSSEASSSETNESSNSCCDHDCKTCLNNTLLQQGTALVRSVLRLPLNAAPFMADHSVLLSQQSPPPISA